MGLVYGLRSRSRQYIGWTVFLFVVIYGSLIHPSHVGDGEVHFLNLHAHYLNLDFDQFWDELIGILSFSPTKSTNDDPYLHILSYLIGTIFNVPKLFFFGVALVFGYFYSRAIVILLSYVKWNSKFNKFYFAFFLVFFLLWQGPSDMQSVRTSTALWVLVYAIVSYHQTKKRKYLFLALLPPIVHVGYFALAIPFWVVLFSGYRNPKVYFIIFMVSVLATNIINQTAVNDLVSETSSVGASKTKAYTRDDKDVKYLKKTAEIESDSRFYKNYKSKKIHYTVLTGLIIYMFLFLRKRGFGQIENTLFSYGLAGASFANFLSFNYAINNRDWQIAGVFILALFVRFLSNYNLRKIPLSFLKVKLPLFIFCLAFVPYLMYLSSAILQNTSAYVIFMPVVMLIDFDMGIGIRAFIGFFM